MKFFIITLFIVINLFASENIVYTNIVTSFINENISKLITLFGILITFITYLFYSKKKDKNKGSILFIGIFISLFSGFIYELFKGI